MGKKMKSVYGGKITVEVPEGYKVFKKDYPKSLTKSKDYGKYKWIGNFGFQKDSGKEVKGDMPKSYEIQVKDRSKATLVYWDVKKKKTIKLKNAKTKKVGKMKMRSAKLRMGDPPIGWMN